MRWVAALAAVVGCGGSEAGGGSAAGADVAVTADVAAIPDAVEDAPEPPAVEVSDPAEVADVPAGPPRICRPGSVWAPGTQAFTDVTEESGLAALGVTGVRLSAADLDGDGLPELVVRNHVQGQRDDFEEGPRYTWLLRNLGGLTFADGTLDSGFTATRTGGQGRTTHIVVFGDADNDGDLDAFSGVHVSQDPAKDNGDRCELLRNDGTGHFELADGGDVRLTAGRYAAGGASFTDFDRDGRLDLFVGYGAEGSKVFADRLYAGDGAGAFSDVTGLVGLTLAPFGQSLEAMNDSATDRNTWGTTVCDLNDDGWPDFVTSSYGRAPNGLWLSDGTGGWENRSVASHVAYDHRVDWTTNFNAQCYCKLEPDAEGCDGVPAPPAYFPCTSTAKLRWDHTYDREPFRLGGNTFSTVCGDLDRDGDLDLMHTEIVHWDVGPTSDPTELLLNDGAGTFARPGQEVTGVGHVYTAKDWNAGDMTGAFLDFDNDGREDVYVGSSDYPGTRGWLYHQGEGGAFTAVDPADGIDHPRSHGIAVADFDGDGDLDVAVGHGRSRCENDPTCYPTAEVHLFRNEVGAAGNWLRIRLDGGQTANRAGIGARVRVLAGGVEQTREVGGGYGHFGMQNDLVLHFGLGDACDVDRVEVRWPDLKGTVEVFEAVQANYVVTLARGGGVRY